MIYSDKVFTKQEFLDSDGKLVIHIKSIEDYKRLVKEYEGLSKERLEEELSIGYLNIDKIRHSTGVGFAESSKVLVYKDCNELQEDYIIIQIHQIPDLFTLNIKENYDIF